MSASERTRTRSSLQSAFKAAMARELSQTPGQPSKEAVLRAAAHACRDLLAERWVSTQQQDNHRGVDAPSRRVHYLSMEFLMGRALGNALAALGLDKLLQEQLDPLGLQLGDVLEREPDAALGNGGLGRLAACFLDSFAETGLPSFGYGLRYQYGMFAQGIDGGKQVESPDDWMRFGAPWEVIRPERRYSVRFGGRVVSDSSHGGHEGGRRWVGGEVVM
ncbi:MAG: glycogen/starch/alpha-glucan phosphorylase, partial [Inhella sp.]